MFGSTSSSLELITTLVIDMKKYLSLFVLLLSASLLMGANYTNATSGLFSATGTWIGGVVPSASGDNWTITNGTTVTYDVNNSATTGWGACTNNGTLYMTNGRPCYYKLNGGLYGSGVLRVGDSTNKIGFTSSNTPAVIIQPMADALINLTNGSAVSMWGNASHSGWVLLASNALVSASSFALQANSLTITSNDIVVLGNSGTQAGAGDIYVVSNYNAGNGVVTLKTAASLSGAGVTNTWLPLSSVNGVPTISSTLTAAQTATTPGTYAVFLNQPIAIYAASSFKLCSTLATSMTNYFFTGVRFHSTGIQSGGSPYHTFSNTTASAFSQIQVSGGSLWYNCIFYDGQQAQYGITSYAYFTNCLTIRCQTGGFYNGNSSGSAIIDNCIGLNNHNGGFTAQANHCSIINSSVYNSAVGQFAFNQCNNTYLFNCKSYNSINGLIAQSCNGFTIENCYATNCSGWILWQNTCANNTVINFTNASSTTQQVASDYTRGNIFINTDLPGYTNSFPPWSYLTPSGYYFGKYPLTFDVANQDYRNFYGYFGYTTYSNNVYAMTSGPWGLNAPVTYYASVTVRPTATRTVTLSCLLTNSVQYTLYSTLGQPPNTKPAPNGSDLKFTSITNSLNVWTNASVTLVNPNAYEQVYAIYVCAQHAATNKTGYTTLSLGQDYSVQKY